MVESIVIGPEIRSVSMVKIPCEDDINIKYFQSDFGTPERISPIDYDKQKRELIFYVPEFEIERVKKENGADVVEIHPAMEVRVPCLSNVILLLCIGDPDGEGESLSPLDYGDDGELAIFYVPGEYMGKTAELNFIDVELMEHTEKHRFVLNVTIEAA